MLIENILHNYLFLIEKIATTSRKKVLRQANKVPVCNFQSTKSPVELNSLLSKFFSFITCLLYQLIRRDTGRHANEAFTSNPIVSSMQYLNGLKITNWYNVLKFSQTVSISVIGPVFVCSTVFV